MGTPFGPPRTPFCRRAALTSSTAAAIPLEVGRHVACRLSLMPSDALTMRSNVCPREARIGEIRRPDISDGQSSEPPKRGRKNGAARNLSKSVEKLFDMF